MFIRKLALALTVLVACPAPVQAFSFTSLYENARQRAQGLISTVMGAKVSFNQVIAATAIGALAGFVVYKLSTRNASQLASTRLSNQKPAQKDRPVSDITLKVLNGDIKDLKNVCKAIGQASSNLGNREKKVKECITLFTEGKCDSLAAVFVVISSLFDPTQEIPGMGTLIEYLRTRSILIWELGQEVLTADTNDVIGYCAIIKNALANSLHERAAIARHIAPEYGVGTVRCDEEKTKITTALEKLFYLDVKEFKTVDRSKDVRVGKEVDEHQAILNAWHKRLEWLNQAPSKSLSTQQQLEIEKQKQAADIIRECAPAEKYSEEFDAQKLQQAREAVKDTSVQFRKAVGQFIIDEPSHSITSFEQINALLKEVLFPNYKTNEWGAYNTLWEAASSKQGVFPAKDKNPTWHKPVYSTVVNTDQELEMLRQQQAADIMRLCAPAQKHSEEFDAQNLQKACEAVKDTSLQFRSQVGESIIEDPGHRISSFEQINALLMHVLFPNRSKEDERMAYDKLWNSAWSKPNVFPAKEKNPTWHKPVYSAVVNTEQELEIEKQKQAADIIRECAPTEKYSQEFDAQKLQKAREAVKDTSVEFRKAVGQFIIDNPGLYISSYEQISALLMDVLFPNREKDEWNAYDSLWNAVIAKKNVFPREWDSN